MTRRNDLDWLRVIAFGLLVIYHVGMYYVSWDWHVKSPAASIAAEPFMLLTGPWRMSLLFLISGVATAHMLRARPQGMLRKRSRQLLWPLLFGMLVIVPPQSYYQAVEQLPGGYTESYWAFYGKYLSAYDGFCDTDGCLRVPTWNHLWFLPYLWVYTLSAWLLWRLLPAHSLSGARHWTGQALAGWRALWVPIAILAVARLLLVNRFEQTHALLDDWYNHAQYGAVFFIGFLAAFSSGFWEALQRLRWPALLLATACYVLLIYSWYFAGYNDDLPPPLALRLCLRVAWAMDQWCAIAALLGFAYRWKDVDSPALRYLTLAVFPLYILHQSVIVVLAHKLKPLHIAPGWEACLLITATFALCFAAYELIRRSTLLRPLFGLRPLPILGDASRQAADLPR